MTSVNRNAIILYRSILRLHKKLPPAMRSLGDDYVKSEFKRHKACEGKFIPPFMQEWEGYLNVLKQQVSQKSPDDSDISFGKKLEPEKLERFTTEQVGQLHVLKQEATLLRPKEQDDHKEDEGLKGTDDAKPKK
ncbi:hypothetical protein MP638_000809 [Amoeboaphelidium occidentale]|nr:hypothetical protein MP638_000809 [Amoeboaphelidium occidentale]